MAVMKRLIQGQDLAFDTHQSGDGQPLKIGGLHMEKRLHRGGKIRFSFFTGEVTSSSNVSAERQDAVVREVRRELRRNPGLQKSLSRTIVDQLIRFSGGNCTVDQCVLAANSIALAFGLGESLSQRVAIDAQGRVVECSTFHLAERPGVVKEIVQRARSVVVQSAKASWSEWRNPSPKKTGAA